MGNKGQSAKSIVVDEAVTLTEVRSMRAPDYAAANEYMGMSPVTLAIINERAKAANVEAQPNEPCDSFGIPISRRIAHDFLNEKEIMTILKGFDSWLKNHESFGEISKSNRETDTVNDPAIVSISHTEPEPEARVR